MSTVTIRDREYEIYPFSDLHLSTISELLTDLGDINKQSDAGFVLSEVILPDLPLDIVRQSKSGKYIILLQAREINTLVIAIVKYFYQGELEAAIARKDKDLANAIREKMIEMQIYEAIDPGVSASEAIAADPSVELVDSQGRVLD